VGRPDGSSAGRHWDAYGAEIGRCAARAWWFYEFKLVLSATLDMLPGQAVLVPAATDEREAAACSRASMASKIMVPARGGTAKPVSPECSPPARLAAT